MISKELAQQASHAPEMHDALCPALTGGKCACSEGLATVDKAWSQFCGGIGRGPDAPYPGMIQAFETHYGQSFTDKDWRNETGVWAAAWAAASRLVRESALEEAAKVCISLAVTDCNDSNITRHECAAAIRSLK